MVNLDRMQRVLVRTKMQGELKYRKGQYILQNHEEGIGCILAANQFGNVKTIHAIAIGFTPFHVSRFMIHIVSIVQLRCHGPLDCIYDLSSR